jgi:hypothetical protein
MKYLVISETEIAPGTVDLFTKQFKTYEKAKPYFEEQKSLINNLKVYLVDVIEESK